jgi:hypothetical protein
MRLRRRRRTRRPSARRDSSHVSGTIVLFCRQLTHTAVSGNVTRSPPTPHASQAPHVAAATATHSSIRVHCRCHWQPLPCVNAATIATTNVVCLETFAPAQCVASTPHLHKRHRLLTRCQSPPPPTSLTLCFATVGMYSHRVFANGHTYTRRVFKRACVARGGQGGCGH